MTRARRLSLAGLITLMGGSGILHFIVPGPYEKIVPGWLPADAAVFWSGVAEVGVAVGLAHPRTRRPAAWATIVLLAAIFPANINHALMAERGTMEWWATRARLPLQAVFVWWASRFALPQQGTRADRPARVPGP